MQGKIIVISGATSGIGKALKERLSPDNTVVSFSRSEEENGKTAFRADVSDRAAVKRVMDAVGRLYGRIDVLINNAGYGMSGATEFLSEEDVRRIVDVNFLGVIWCCQCALPYMSKGAKIGVISSAGGITPMPYRAMYNCTKAAIIGFSKSLNTETRHLGIDCSVFILGVVDTDFAKHRKISSADAGRYAEDLKAVDAFVDNPARGGKMKTSAVAEFIVRRLGRKHTKASYIVGFRYRLANLVYLFFPVLSQRIVEFVMRH